MVRRDKHKLKENKYINLAVICDSFSMNRILHFSTPLPPSARLSPATPLYTTLPHHLYIH